MAYLKHACLWETLSPGALVTPPLDCDVAADVCVIGGGITGLSTALHLLEHGHTVVVLEAHRIGHGGSGRNVGLVNAGTWIRPDDVEATLGSVQGSRLNTLLGDAPGEVFALIDRLGIDCQARQRGNLHMAHNVAGLADLQARLAQWTRRGAKVELLTGTECRTYCGTDRIDAALLDHRAGTLDPMAYTQGLARAVLRLGGRIFQQTPVQRLTREAGHWCATTSARQVQAERVVVSTGAYSEGDWNTLRKQFFRGYYYQVASAPLHSEAAARVLPHGQGAWDTRTVLSSIRRDAEGRILLGSLGRVDNKPAWFIRRWAERIQRHYFPALGNVEWQMHWTGCIDFTPDHLMRLFEPAPGLVAVTGYNGRGNTTGTVVGRAMADYVHSGERAQLPLAFSPLQPVRAAGLRTAFYESGFSLYHAGQCLRVVL